MKTAVETIRNHHTFHRFNPRLPENTVYNEPLVYRRGWLATH